jgi:hypothetical protein
MVDEVKNGQKKQLLKMQASTDEREGKYTRKLENESLALGASSGQKQRRTIVPAI